MRAKRPIPADTRSDHGLPFSPWQLTLVVALHAAVWAALVTGEARAVAPASPALMVKMIAPHPLPLATPAAPKREAPAVPRQQPERPATASPARVLAAAANAPARSAAPAPAGVSAASAPAAAAVADALVASAAAQPDPPALTEPRFDANYLDNPAPAYPPLSRRLGEQGTVFLRVFVDADGHPAAVEVKAGSGSPRLDQAAQEAVRRWRFLPARRGAEAASAWVVVPVAFHLKG